MKYVILLGGTLLGAASGYGLMYFLHSSENKLDNPAFTNERVQLALFFAAVCVWAAQLMIKGLPFTRENPDASRLETVLHSLPFDALLIGGTVLICYLASSLGWLSRESSGFWTLGVSFTIALAIVFLDEDYERCAGAYLKPQKTE